MRQGVHDDGSGAAAAGAAADFAAAAEAGAAAGAGAATVQLAVATVGAINLAVPVAVVLQALPASGALHPLPRRKGALCGVAEHAGRLVPVVDLARWLDVGTAGTGQTDGTVSPPDRQQRAAKGARILVLADGTRTLGLCVDSVLGLTEVPAAALARVQHDDDGEEVFHTAVRAPELDRVLSILDVGRLATLASAWHEAAPDAAASDAVADSSQRPTLQYALLAVGSSRIALPATALAEVIRMPVLHAIGAPGGSSYCGWRGRQIAVLDAAAMLGIADTASEPAPLLAIVEHEGLALGLKVREALELRALPAAQHTPAVKGAPLSVTMYDGEEHGAIEQVDTHQLFARTPEAALSRAVSEPDAASDGVTAQRLNAGAYVVFQTDQHHATPIAPIEEILALGAEHIDAHERVLPTIAWRRQALPVIDLRPAGTPTPAKSGARIIVVRGADGCTGYVVRHVVLLIPPNTGKLYRMALAGTGLVEFITTGERGDQVSYRTMDLSARPAATR